MAIDDRRLRDRATRRQLITATARVLVEREGWDAVTTRRLSTEIEYSQPVIYKHSASMEDLVEAGALEGSANLPRPAVKLDAIPLLYAWATAPSASSGTSTHSPKCCGRAARTDHAQPQRPATPGTRHRPHRAPRRLVPRRRLSTSKSATVVVARALPGRRTRACQAAAGADFGGTAPVPARRETDRNSGASPVYELDGRNLAGRRVSRHAKRGGVRTARIGWDGTTFRDPASGNRVALRNNAICPPSLERSPVPVRPLKLFGEQPVTAPGVDDGDQPLAQRPSRPGTARGATAR